MVSDCEDLDTTAQLPKQGGTHNSPKKRLCLAPDFFRRDGLDFTAINFPRTPLSLSQPRFFDFRFGQGIKAQQKPLRKFCSLFRREIKRFVLDCLEIHSLYLPVHT